jgi:Uma2 family endonuclease
MEILSNSTEAYDRGEKFLYYQNISSLKEYYLISQKSKIIERFTKKDNNNWEYSKFSLDDNSILIISKFKISVDSIYRKINI